MKGLLLKDLALMKSQMAFLMIPLVVILGIFCVFTDGSAIAAIPAFFGLMLSLNAFAYDEQSHFDKFAATMPVSRGGIVLARYLYGILISVLASALALIVTIVVMLVKGSPVDYAALFMEMAAGVAVTALIIAIFYPLVYKFGTQKGRIVVILAIMLPSFGMASLMGYLSENGIPLPDITLGGWLPAVLVVLMAAVLAISIACSLHVVRHKEY